MMKNQWVRYRWQLAENMSSGLSCRNFPSWLGSKNGAVWNKVGDKVSQHGDSSAKAMLRAGQHVHAVSCPCTVMNCTAVQACACMKKGNFRYAADSNALGVAQ